MESLPKFLQSPRNSFIVKNRPTKLQCEVKDADRVIFNCNGQQMTADQSSNDHNVESLKKLTLNVSRRQVDAFFSRFRFRCKCEAWNSVGHVVSRGASIEVAYLKKIFEHEPTGGNAIIGREFKLQCSPPNGHPLPQVSWTKNGRPLEDGGNLFTTQSGDLIIQTRDQHDAGNYTCVARNMAGKRSSHTAVVRVGVDGGWSKWSPWSDCGGRCGVGERKRTRTCDQPKPLNGGRKCPGISQQTRSCSKLCPLKDDWSDWSKWTACDRNCQQNRDRTCDQKLHFTCHGPDTQTRTCPSHLCTTGPTIGPRLAVYGCLSAAILVFFLFILLALFLYKRRTSSSYYQSPHRRRDTSGKVVKNEKVAGFDHISRSTTHRDVTSIDLSRCGFLGRCQRHDASHVMKFNFDSNTDEESLQSVSDVIDDSRSPRFFELKNKPTYEEQPCITSSILL